MNWVNIVAFFAKVPKQVYLGLAALLLLAGAVWYCSEQVEDRVDKAEEIGKIEERNDQLEETIKNIETAENAREEINDPTPSGDRTRYNQCLHTSRTPANCERLLPSVQETKR